MVLTECPGSSDPFYILTYYIKWVTTSWTHSILYDSIKFALKIRYEIFLHIDSNDSDDYNSR